MAKGLTIVVDEKHEIYGNILLQLIGQCDDNEGEIVGVKDGSVNAVVMTEKEYIANKVKISSNDHVLFIGETESAKKQGILYSYKKYDMCFGTNGKRAVLHVDKYGKGKKEEKKIKKKSNKGDTSAIDEYNEFLQYAKTYQNQILGELNNMSEVFTKRVKDASKGSIMGGFAAMAEAAASTGPVVTASGHLALLSLGTLFAPVAGAAVTLSASYSLYKGIKAIQTLKAIKDQKYKCLLLVVYKDFLQKFMEE